MTTATLQEQLFRLPDLGEGLTEAEIVEWKVAVGDTVTIDQIVIEVETAKAAVEVPVPYAGTVLRLHAEAGTALAVGEPLITVGAGVPGEAEGTAGGSGDPSPGGPAAGSASADPAADRYREEEQAGSGNVLIGYGTGHGPAPRRRRRRTGAATGGGTGTEAAQPFGPHAPRVVSPLVRRMAREHGIDLAGVAPSGPAGIVLRRDVEQAVARVRQTSTDPEAAPVAPAQQASADLTPAPQGRPAADGPQRIPLRGVRRAVADKLSRSRTEIPDATTWVDVDATGLLQAKKALEAAEPGRRIGLLALLARICVAGLRRFPELNSTVDTERREILRFNEVHLGFAAQTERGLVVPVVRDAHLMTTVQLALELARLTELARAGSLPPDRLTGGTFTLNNYGVFGVDGSTPIINHPEAALLGAGRIVDKPWVVDGALAVRRVMQLSFSFDHRVCDGGVAGGFLRYVADCVERPAILLADA
ncbi:2-oxo acid dehydrogenase subunit E2 [Streptomyces sp. NBC_00201]|uniref:dihydrolipoamide acetyltransferase family protein n=1 Tax=unclassified Streptomyces TaxID=2593676 RepID=UPI00224E4A20|nr:MULTISPECIES: dihydrolipoamide acetyltransferase family protein [unclassified Streptomyces]MCX5062780.1 2-oxo acid dehydrogenase subunit E2 [Streptomyces sp. NBC_00452]MCX5250459.1 2-oxo acid dehydrogenase subunit E2 [Streptomyces sp. NBC_00201]MCX5291614.1 2-oxo acid dehydrogenase subunit E2 [Streptomyces sp. NBC_00183]